MTKYKYLIILISLLGLVSLSAYAQKTKLTEFPDCRGRACIKTALVSPWPDALTAPKISIDVNQFSISLPSQPQRVYSFDGSEISVFFKDHSSLSFSLDTKISMSDISLWLEGSHYSVADSAEFIFTKTTKELSDIKNDEDLLLMKRALLLKEQIFSDENEVFVSKNENFTIYYWNDLSLKELDKTSFAYLFSHKNRDKYLRVSGFNIEFEDFKRIVGSLETTEGLNWSGEND